MTLQVNTKSIRTTFAQWFDSGVRPQADKDENTVDWLRVIPFIAMHLCCLLVFVVGYSQIAVLVAVASYLLRMFAITAFYHRYFSHRAFKTNRFWQFVFAYIGACSTQRGPLWWAAHHRRHHRYSDKDLDSHSPRHSFFWGHMGWFLSIKHFKTHDNWIRDFSRYPELRWLDRYDVVAPVSYAFMMFGLGYTLERFYPELHTTGWQMLIWGYFISTIVLIHCTLLVNSLGHLFGTQRYHTDDESRNNAFLSLIALGEGWHNNHHHYPVSARQGFYWWEFDLSYYLLVLLSWLGIVSDLKALPPERIEQNRIRKPLK